MGKMKRYFQNSARCHIDERLTACMREMEIARQAAANGYCRRLHHLCVNVIVYLERERARVRGARK